MKKIVFLALILACYPTLSFSQSFFENDAKNQNNTKNQDDAKSRLAAANRYADTMDFNKMMANMTAQMATKMPENKRASFVREMSSLDWSWMRKLMVTSMVQVFSTKELNTLADFYGSPTGREITRKLPAYMASFLSVAERQITQEMAASKNR
ncbi:DUF2059 domain-containing protein [Varunaivibrio sulfuroxidans]|uniref:Uncharacterized protein DUF2059 n=1 Tax=Varunaivibrio sulfuroxidans TaxID=1773489 RepID=A0A4R3JB85_9PROT|nr:DUF2059 domain-containing protein [Varunaivibrio sulfuroxidans]TCS63168.1 uncharacterized protein DUF2059 [Varunaivibrio sulfuroxidans]WES31770.1 DUF2059 domain-containing protein [Varunaivibrio sulfuroxidans]